jgi:hypothetical protein
MEGRAVRVETLVAITIQILTQRHAARLIRKRKAQHEEPSAFNRARLMSN